MDVETIKQFIDLNRSKKFNLLLTIFSSLISGFLIIIVINPGYSKELSAFLVVLLSLAAIAPIYIFNQICSVVFISQIAKKGLRHLITFANLPENQDEAINELTDYIASHLTVNAIYNSPARQVAEIITIIATYLSALLAWLLSLTLLIIYPLLVVFSVLLFLLTIKIASKIISQVTPEHFEPIMRKLRNDEEFKEHISKRIKRIEKIIKEKKQEEEQQNQL